MTRFERDSWERLRQIVEREIPVEDYAVFVFGSRARGSVGRASDVDIGVLGRRPVSARVTSRILRAVEESRIPWKIDLVDFGRTDARFDDLALRDYTVWNNPFDENIETLLHRRKCTPGVEGGT